MNENPNHSSGVDVSGFAASAARRWRLRGALILGVFLLAASAAQAGPCQKSARQARKACGFDVKDDFWEQMAMCTHRSDADDRAECLEEAGDDRDENLEECDAVFDARVEFCEASGEDRYDPPFRKSMFTSTFDNANPYFPLKIGNRWEFESEDEEIVVEVLDATKRIGRIDCLVVNDVVSDEDGLLIEDTDDWYGQAKNGDVYYCGENAKDYAYIKGDEPQEAELVEIDGSFKQGVDGAKAGIQMFMNPVVGVVYRQEFALGNAEDGAEILSTTYSYGDGSGLDKLVPKALAELMCDGDCLVTRDFNLLEPDGEEYKYFAPGVGPFLEVNRRQKEVTALVDCNVDARCDSL